MTDLLKGVVKNFRNHWPLAAVFLLIIVFYWPLVSLKSIPYSGDLIGSDLTEINYPLRKIAHQSLRSGSIPFWSHLISSGYPVFAESEAGFFYPPNIIFSLFSPSFLAAFNWSLVFHLLLAALFFYLFARLLKASALASAFGAFVFVFSSLFVTKLKYTNMIMTLAWLPLEFWLVEKWYQEKKAVYLLFLAPIVAVKILAGHSQVALISFFGVGLYFLGRLISVPDQSKMKKLAFLGVFLLSALLTVGLTSFQILPSLELAKESWRSGGLNILDSVISSYHPQNLATWIIPFFFGNPAEATYLFDFEDPLTIIGLYWEIATYIGFLTFFLGVIAAAYLIRTKFRENWPWLLLIFLPFLLALGQHAGVYVLAAENIPLFKFFRVPARFMILVMFSLCVFVAVGFDILKERLANFWNKKKLVANSLLFLLVTITIFDLFKYASTYNTFLEAKSWFAKPESVKYLETDEDFFRVYSYGSEFSWWHAYQQAQGWMNDKSLIVNHREILEPNFNAVWEVASLDDLVSLKLRKWTRFREFLKFAGIRDETKELFVQPFPKGRTKIFSEGMTKILGMQGTKYILTFFDIKSDDLELKRQIRFDDLMLPLNIYENKKFLPVANFVSRARLVETDGTFEDDLKYFSTLYASDFEPQKEILVEGLTREQQSEGSNASGSIEILDWKNSLIRLKVLSDGRGWAVVANSFYPGWKAVVDGVEQKISRANYLYQAVPVGGGEHIVEMSYESKTFKTGLYISLISIIIWLTVIFYVRSKKRKI